MLKEEQAARLLLRCEELAGRRLTSLRGNLRRASTRAAAVWEMLVFEAAAELGPVEYEDPLGGPDIKLHLSDARFVWIEVAYLYPRFEDEERRSRALSNWVHGEAARIGFVGSLRCDFFGDPKNPAGPVRTLPAMNQQKVFLRDPEVAAFFELLKSPLKHEHKVTLSRWTVSLTASPALSRFRAEGGLVQESPREIREHAAYRTLLRKRRQHKVDAPRIVCIGSDTSRAVASTSSADSVRLEHALSAALSKNGSISGIYVIEIANTRDGLFGWKNQAKSTFYPVSERFTRVPLLPHELTKLGTLNLNRWAYTFAFDRWTEDIPAHMVRTTNSLRIGTGRNGAVKLSIPGAQLIRILAGRGNLISAYSIAGDPPDAMLTKLLGDAWRVVDCRLVPGDIKAGLSELVELTLEPSHERVFQRAASSRSTEHNTPPVGSSE